MSNGDREFLQEYLCEPFPLNDRLYALAMEYHHLTEAYDRTVCTGLRNGVAVPQSAEQSRLINHYARQLIENIVKREGGGIDLQTSLRKMISYTARSFANTLKGADHE